MTRRFLIVALSLGCGCNSLYLQDGGGAGASTGTGTSIEFSTGGPVTTTVGLTEATTGSSTTVEAMPISSAGEASTSTGEASTSTGEVSTSTGTDESGKSTGTSDTSSGNDPEATGGEEPVRYVFLTSQRFDGSMRPNPWLVEPGFDGLARADKRCQMLAEKEKLSGTYTAWLSSNSEDAGERTRGGGSLPDFRLVLMNGEVVAGDWEHFTSAGPKVQMMLTEKNQLPDHMDYQIWSGTKPDGTFDDSRPNCANWELSILPWEGMVGDVETLNSEWSSGENSHCDQSHPLLCIQTSL